MKKFFVLVFPLAIIFLCAAISHAASNSFEEALALYRNGSYESALVAFSDHLKHYPRDEEAKAYMADLKAILMKGGSPQYAIETLPPPPPSSTTRGSIIELMPKTSEEGDSYKVRRRKTESLDAVYSQKLMHLEEEMHRAQTELLASRQAEEAAQKRIDTLQGENIHLTKEVALWRQSRAQDPAQPTDGKKSVSRLQNDLFKMRIEAEQREHNLKKDLRKTKELLAETLHEKKVIEGQKEESETALQNYQAETKDIRGSERQMKQLIEDRTKDLETSQKRIQILQQRIRDLEKTNQKFSKDKMPKQLAAARNEIKTLTNQRKKFIDEIKQLRKTNQHLTQLVQKRQAVTAPEPAQGEGFLGFLGFGRKTQSSVEEAPQGSARQLQAQLAQMREMHKIRNDERVRLEERLAEATQDKLAFLEEIRRLRQSEMLLKSELASQSGIESDTPSRSTRDPRSRRR